MTTTSISTKGATFAVANVPRATQRLRQVAYREALDELLEAEKLVRGKEYRPVEACNRMRRRLVDDVRGHPFVAALGLAYADHRPISFSPDMVWLLICQGVAHHINANAEALRPRFVAHEGKRTLAIRRDDFLKGSPDNAWPEVFGSLSAQFREHVGACHDLFVPSFSTTGPVERAASEIVLMDAMKRYFHYLLVRCICGIPAITLEGTPDDWQSIVDRTEKFASLDLEWWLRPLRPFLREFHAASEGRVNEAVWRSIYRIYRSDRPCGGSSRLGWINLFFPYLTGSDGLPTERNPWLSGERDPEELLAAPAELKRKAADEARRSGWSSPIRRPGFSEAILPSGLARAPFTWEVRDEKRNIERSWNMEMLAGFVGVAQDSATLCLRPEIGWAVREAPTPQAPS